MRNCRRSLFPVSSRSAALGGGRATRTASTSLAATRWFRTSISDGRSSAGLRSASNPARGRKFIALIAKEWLGRPGVATLSHGKGLRQDVDDNESFNGKLHDELSDRETFCSPTEGRLLIEAGQRHNDTECPYGSLDWRSPTSAKTGPPRWPPDSAVHPLAIQHGGGRRNPLTFPSRPPMRGRSGRRI